MKNQANPALGMYIDDGAIFACSRAWRTVENALRDSYSSCIEWLARAGLSAEPDKTELIYFKKPKEKATPPNYIHLPMPAANTYYRVKTTNKLRYLGFFLDTRLTWLYHVEVMCNRARATIKALRLLRNSVRGLNHAKWRLTYNAVCLPVLMYGCQLWYTGKQKTLVKKLQMVQNEAVRVIAGAFRTTPCEPLHQLLTILPMDIRLEMLTQNTALRLYRVSSDSQLLKRLGGDWYTAQLHDPPLPAPNNVGTCSTLCSLASRVSAKCLRIQLFPELPPDAPYWDGRVTCTPRQDNWDYLLLTKSLVKDCQEARPSTFSQRAST